MLFRPSDCSVTSNPRRGNPDGSPEMLYVLVDGLPMAIMDRHCVLSDRVWLRRVRGVTVGVPLFRRG